MCLVVLDNCDEKNKTTLKECQQAHFQTIAVISEPMQLDANSGVSEQGSYEANGWALLEYAAACENDNFYD